MKLRLLNESRYLSVVATSVCFVMLMPVVAKAASYGIDLLNLNQTNPGLADEFLSPGKMRLAETWELLNGDTTITISPVEIGIIDRTAIDGSHPEFAGKEVNDSFIGKVQFGSTSLSALKPQPPFDPHSTEVASIIGANNISAYSSQIYEFPHMNGVLSGVKRLNYTLEFRPPALERGIIPSVDTVFKIRRAMTYLIERGIPIINFSRGQPSTFFNSKYPADVLEEKIKSATNTLFVVAAGKNGEIAEETSPANLGNDLENVITVGAININNDRDPFSDFGNAVNLSAQGDSLHMPIRYVAPLDINDYTTASGTSFSAPFVTGVAGLLKALEPEYQKYTPGLIMSPTKIKEILVKSADPLFALVGSDEAGKFLGTDCIVIDRPPFMVKRGCRLNAHRAVSWLLPPKAVENC